MRLDRYLSQTFTYLSRNEWQRKISDGALLLNGKKAKASTAIPRESRLSYDIGDYEERPVNTHYRVVHNDPHMMVVDKPPNIPVHTSGKYFNNTLIKLIRRDFPEDHLNLVNRLDRETSGLIVLAKHSEAHRRLAAQFTRQKIQKTYITYVFGEVAGEKFLVDAPIAPHGSRVVRIRMGVDKKEGRSAITHFEVISRKNGFTKLFCYPRTGRTNQIRVHLAHIGHPLVGDKLYSGNDEDFLSFIENGNTPKILGRVIMERHALHAWRLVFAHPGTGERITCRSEEPEDMLGFGERYLKICRVVET